MSPHKQAEEAIVLEHEGDGDKEEIENKDDENSPCSIEREKNQIKLPEDARSEGLLSGDAKRRGGGLRLRSGCQSGCGGPGGGCGGAKDGPGGDAGHAFFRYRSRCECLGFDLSTVEPFSRVLGLYHKNCI
nr:auxin transporter-like protein 2 [Ipomoea trifida]